MAMPGWIYKSMPKEDAEALLSSHNAKDGQFLLRKHKGNGYVMSLMFKGRPTHHLMVFDADKGTWTVNKKAYGSFKTLKELMDALHKPLNEWPIQLHDGVVDPNHPAAGPPSGGSIKRKRSGSTRSLAPLPTKAPESTEEYEEQMKTAQKRLQAIDKALAQATAHSNKVAAEIESSDGKEEGPNNPDYLWDEPMAREDAEAKLQGSSDGTFLIRRRPGNESDFIASITFRSKPTHHLLALNENGLWLVNKKLYGDGFSTLSELFTALGEGSINGWPVPLTNPIKDPNKKKVDVEALKASKAKADRAIEQHRKQRDATTTFLSNLENNKPTNGAAATSNSEPASPAALQPQTEVKASDPTPAAKTDAKPDVKTEPEKSKQGQAPEPAPEPAPKSAPAESASKPEPAEPEPEPTSVVVSQSKPVAPRPASNAKPEPSPDQATTAIPQNSGIPQPQVNTSVVDPAPKEPAAVPSISVTNVDTKKPESVAPAASTSATSVVTTTTAIVSNENVAETTIHVHETDGRAAATAWAPKPDYQTKAPSGAVTLGKPATVEIGGRQGHADFINGKYEEDPTKFYDGKPVFKHHYVLQGLQEAVTKTLYLFYHQANAAWAISQQLGDRGIAAFIKSKADRPEDIRGTWQVASAHGTFEADSNVRVGSGDPGSSSFQRLLASNSEVNFFQCKLTAQQFTELCLELRAGSCAIKRLKLFENALTKAQAIELIKAMENNTSVTHLQLRNNNLDDDVADHVAKLIRNNTTLRLLSLRGNNIGDEGAKWIAEAVRTNRTLTGLSLRENDVADMGLERLSDALAINDTLRGLAVYDNKFKPSLAKRLLKKVLKRNRSCSFEIRCPAL